MGLAPEPLARPFGLLALEALRSQLALTAGDILKADAFNGLLGIAGKHPIVDLGSSDLRQRRDR